MFEYDFMQRALLAGIFLSLTIPLIGVVMVSRKTSMLGEAMSHVSLAGVGLGLVFGFSPVLGAVGICILAGLSIERVRKRFLGYGDMATAIVTSVGLGLAAIISGFLPSGSSLESYLFGSIASVSLWDVIVSFIIFILVGSYSLVYYTALANLALSESFAYILGVKVKVVSTLYTILAALTVAMAAKMIGALLVSSLIVLPTVSALCLAKSYRHMIIFTTGFGVLYMMSGLVLSYYIEISPGGAVVAIALFCLGLLALGKKVLTVK